MSSEKVVGILLGLLTTIALGIASWSLNVTLTLKEDNRLMGYKLDQLQSDSDVDNDQNRRLAAQRSTDSKFWKLHRWTKDEIDNMRVKDGDGISMWPDIGEHGHDHPHP